MKPLTNSEALTTEQQNSQELNVVMSALARKRSRHMVDLSCKLSHLTRDNVDVLVCEHSHVLFHHSISQPHVHVRSIMQHLK